MANSDVGEKITKVVEYSADKAASSVEWVKNNPKKTLAVAGIVLSLVMLNGCSGGKKEVTLPDGSVVEISSKKLESGKTLQVIKNEDGDVVKIPGESVGSCDGLESEVCIKQKEENCPDGDLDTRINKDGKVGKPFCKTEKINTKYYGDMNRVVTTTGIRLEDKNGSARSNTYKNITEVNGFLVAEQENKKKIVLGPHLSNKNATDPFFSEMYIFQSLRYKSTVFGVTEKSLGVKRRVYEETVPLGDEYIIGYFNVSDKNGHKYKLADLLETKKEINNNNEYYVVDGISLGDQNINRQITFFDQENYVVKDYKNFKVGDNSFLVKILSDDRMVIIRKDETGKLIKNGQTLFFNDIKESNGYIVGVDSNGLEYPLNRDGGLKFNGALRKIKNYLNEDIFIVTENFNAYNEKNYLLLGEEKISVDKYGPIIAKDGWIINANGEKVQKIESDYSFPKAGDGGIYYLIDGKNYGGYYNKNDINDFAITEEFGKKGGEGKYGEKYEVIAGKLYFRDAEEYEEDGGWMIFTRYKFIYYRVDKKTGKKIGEAISQEQIDKIEDEWRKQQNQK